VRTFSESPFPEKLSAWRLFRRVGGKLQPNRGVIPYDLINPLFTDYAAKHRFVWMPPGKPALYRRDDTFEFPEGAIPVKTFAYPAAAGMPERWIETRLLVHTHDAWVPLPYVWNPESTEATLQVDADPVDVAWHDESGRSQNIHYVIPNANQCRECHDQNKITGPIGPKARHLNRDLDYPDGRFNQLAYWTRIGYLAGAPGPAAAPRQPVWDDPSSAPLGARARAYLEINCAHCHSPAGAAGNTGLYLSDLQTDPSRIGICKTPVATGKASADMLFDLVPGRPGASILLFRMDSIEPKIMMPEIGRTIVHRQGVELVREWLASLRGDCGTPRSQI
jgi:uncharacterized repeat protein (TIGR03806 family)